MNPGIEKRNECKVCINFIKSSLHCTGHAERLNVDGTSGDDNVICRKRDVRKDEAFSIIV